MQCAKCGKDRVKRFGKDRHGHQRFRCLECGKTFIVTGPKLLGNMRISLDDAERCLSQLLEGSSIRSTSRLTGIDRDTVIALLVMIGERCKAWMERELVDVCVDEVQADEVWSFIFCKEKHSQRMGYDGSTGDAYCFVGVERNTKLVVSWLLGKRSPECTQMFADKLKVATAGRFQLSTDGWTPYQTAMPRTFGSRVNFGTIVKIYGKVGEGDQRRYSPPAIVEIKREHVWGNPDMNRVCTSHIERSNLSMRMSIRRMTRLTNGFSKKWENHEAAIALWFAFYNFCRRHMTLKTTPAVASGLTDHQWTIRELLERVATAA